MVVSRLVSARRTRVRFPPAPPKTFRRRRWLGAFWASRWWWRSWWSGPGRGVAEFSGGAGGRSLRRGVRRREPGVAGT